jgi:hypothetical protein
MVIDHAPAATVTALALGLYALHDTLVEKGLLAEGEAAATLKWADRHDNAELMANVEAVAENLDKRPFRFVPRKGFEVIEGGRD